MNSNANPDTSSAVDTSIELANTVFAIVKEVGEMLNNVPYVKSLSGVILQIIKVRNEFKANEERCHEIIDKVLRMSKSIYEKLAMAARSNQREKLNRLEGHLNKHERTLTAVHAALKKYQSRSRFSKAINRGLDELNKHDRRLDELNTQLILDIIFEIILEQATSAPITDLQTTTTSEHVLPPRPDLMVQRDASLDTALEVLLNAAPSRVAILGGGGFGKTTLARAILHEPKIAERYQSRYFLSCEGMADADALLLGLGSMLGITATPSTMLASIRSFLATSTTLLCLDNFETPWEPSVSRTKIEETLASIADIPNLSLIIAMRGTQRPSKIAWSQPLLPPLSTLSAESARLILQRICPDHVIDTFTDQLLDGIDGIPLAVTLISNLFRDGETSESLWQQWSKKQTRVIHTGADDRQSNLNISISLSMESHRMKRDPDATILLAALSLLPSGFPWDMDALTKLEKYIDISDIHSALQTLRTVSLIETKISGRIQMLSPIRLFCLQFLASTISLGLEKVADYYISIMLEAGYKYDNAELYAQVVSEIQNIHSVFQKAYKVGYSQDIIRLIDSTVYLTSWSIYIGYLAQDTIQMAIKISVNFPVPHAKCLISLGDLYEIEGQDTRAETCFREAAALLKHGNDKREKALALCRLGDVLTFMGQLDEAEVSLKSSLELYTQADHKHGQANVGLSLGELYVFKAQYSEAESTLTGALEACKQIPDLIGHSNAAESLTRLHFNCGNLVEAEKYAAESLDTAKQANNALGEGNALVWLGNIYLAIDRVPDAIQALDQALAINKQQNNSVNQLETINNLAKVYIQSDQLSAAETLLTESAKVDLNVVQIPIILTTLAWLYICGDHLDKAEPLLDDALQRFRKFDDKPEQAKVLAHLGTVYLKSNRLDEAERALKSIPDLGVWRDIEIHRLWVLGDLYIIKGQLEDAKASLDAAMACCQNHSKEFLRSYQQGNILRSMGTLHIKRGRVDRAIRAFKRAREFHHKAQWVSEQATDLKRLGEAYVMLDRAEDGDAAFKEAEELMESVREARTLKE